jgi:Type IX secretion system protein PorV
VTLGVTTPRYHIIPRRRWTGLLPGIVGFLLLCSGNASAQSSTDKGTTITKVSTTSAQFLKLGVGARAIALGGSSVASVADLSAMYWNPAGLASIEGSSFQASYTQYIANIDYTVAAYGTQLAGLGTIAFSFTLMNSGDMEVRTVRQPEGTTDLFTVQSYAMQMSYGKYLTDRFSMGGSVKFIREQIWHSSAQSFAVDVGSQFRTPYNRLKIGASISNFGPNMRMNGRDILFSQDPDQQNQGNVDIVNARYETDSFPLPLVFRIGLTWEPVTNANYTIRFNTDASHPNDNSEYMNVGAEYDFRDLLALRGGYKNLFEQDGEQGLTFGGGLNVRLDRSSKVQIDYAYADFGRLQQTHWFTLGIDF